MPICPGCERKIPFDRLDIHERYCEGIWSADELGRNAERLEARIMELEERLDGRLRDLESSVEQRLHDLENSQRAQRMSRRK